MPNSELSHPSTLSVSRNDIAWTAIAPALRLSHSAGCGSRRARARARRCTPRAQRYMTSVTRPTPRGGARFRIISSIQRLRFEERHQLDRNRYTGQAKHDPDDRPSRPVRNQRATAVANKPVPRFASTAEPTFSFSFPRSRSVPDRSICSPFSATDDRRRVDFRRSQPASRDTRSPAPPREQADLHPRPCIPPPEAKAAGRSPCRGLRTVAPRRGGWR